MKNHSGVTFAAVVAASAFAAGAILLIGCAPAGMRGSGSYEVSRSPESPWVPPRQALDKQKSFQAGAVSNTAPSIPADILDKINNLTLADIVNIALLNNTQTREAWAQARASAALFRSAQGSWFPTITGSVTANQEKNMSAGTGLNGTPYYVVSGTLSWLLFDFGGRSSAIEETREALFAANWNHNATIQNVILQVEQAYYNYFTTKTLLAAQQTTVKEAQANLDASQTGDTSGVATVADVLQARTALSQAELSLETLQGQIMVTRGALATAMGISPSTSFDLEPQPFVQPVDSVKKSVMEYFDVAMRRRPDLAAARALAIEARAHVQTMRAQGLPSLFGSGSLGRLYSDTLSQGSTSYSATIGLNIPLFAGFSHWNNVKAAQAQADAANAAAQSVHDQVVLQVWTSYYSLETSDQMVRASNDLVASATQNHDVAMGRYKTGVGSILDLLTAQAALDNARAQQIEANADWRLALAQLAHDTGTMEAGGK